MPKIIKYFQEKVVFLPVQLPPQHEFNLKSILKKFVYDFAKQQYGDEKYLQIITLLFQRNL